VSEVGFEDRERAREYLKEKELTERLRYWYESREECRDDVHINIHGMKLRKDDEVIIKVKSKGLGEIRGRVVCYNPFWGTVIIDTEDVEIMVKVRDIVYIQRRKVGR
jgi:hypothetical protein